MEFTENDIARFWNKVDIKACDECWNWTASCNKTGYGYFKLNGKMEKAHRVALVLSCCPQIENKLFSLHTCKQNTKCCNPSHLYWGDYYDNAGDKKIDDTGVYYSGETNGRAKLTETQILEIREKYIPYKYSSLQLADEYGVTTTTILNIINRKLWKHL